MIEFETDMLRDDLLDIADEEGDVAVEESKIEDAEEEASSEDGATEETHDDESDEADDDDDDEALSVDSLMSDDDEASDEEDDGPKAKTLEDMSNKLPKDNESIAVGKNETGETEVKATAPDPSIKKPKKGPRKRWYVINTYSGHENKVKINLERRIESMGMADKIFRVEVPSKTVTKIKDGRRTERDERVFPGYVLVEMLMDDDSWYVVRHTPGVTKFVGSQKRPIAAKDAEIKRILMRTQPVASKVQIDLKVGETVKITSGPFADLEGTITEVSPEKERIKASVSIFGRETPVELAFNQIQKSS